MTIFNGRCQLLKNNVIIFVMWGLIFISFVFQYITKFFSAFSYGLQLTFMIVFIMYLFEGTILCFFKSMRMLNVRFFISFILLLVIIGIAYIEFLFLFIFDFSRGKIDMMFPAICAVWVLLITLIDAIKYFSNRIQAVIMSMLFYIFNSAIFMSLLAL